MFASAMLLWELLSGRKYKNRNKEGRNVQTGQAQAQAQTQVQVEPHEPETAAIDRDEGVIATPLPPSAPPSPGRGHSIQTQLVSKIANKGLLLLRRHSTSTGLSPGPGPGNATPNRRRRRDDLRYTPDRKRIK